MAIKLLIDSASDIDIDEAASLGVELIPMEINFGDEHFYDGVTLKSSRFFEKLVESEEFPKTSQINEYRFDEVFARMTGEDEVICITMSSKLSGTYFSACRAADKYGGKVRVVDSNNVCIGERVLIFYALSLIEKGMSACEIENELNRVKGKIKLMALLDTLQYLKKGGRISSAAAFAGELLSIKPVISITDGEVILVGKALGSRKGANLLTKLIENAGGIDFDMPFAAAYSGLSDALLRKYLEDSKCIWEGHTDSVPLYLIGSTIGTHAGPGAIAVAFFGIKE